MMVKCSNGRVAPMGNASVYVFVTSTILLACAATAAGQLSMNYYASTCPQAEAIVTTTIQSASVVDPVIPAKILRLFFHDCFVQGCDGSILIDSTANQTAEKDDPTNKTVEGYNLVDAIKSALEMVCPGTVSCADIVALAAKTAVFHVGGPDVQIPTGRLDGRVSDASVVSSNLPDTNFNLDQLLKFFNSKGLSMTDVVTLAGAHTIGVAHCNAFNDRFAFNNHSVAQVDPSMNPAFSAELMATCPKQPDPSTTVPLDTTTPRLFDNAYYFNLQAGKGLMTADQTLFTDSRSKSTVLGFANDQSVFFNSWSTSFLKLSQVGVKTAMSGDGEVRESCRVVNA